MPGKLAGASSPVGPLSERILAGFRRQVSGQRPRWQPVDPANPSLSPYPQGGTPALGPTLNAGEPQDCCLQPAPLGGAIQVANDVIGMPDSKMAL